MGNLTVMLAMCTFLLLPKATLAEEAVDRTGTFDFGLAYRTDRLDWNIASDVAGTAIPNIQSELTWKKLQILQAGGGAAFAFGRFVLRLAAEYGWILAGDNQDSDFNSNNRGGEFSRSNNDAGAGNVWDISAAFGYRFGEHVYLTPLVGLSLHQQNLRVRNGYQTIASAGLTPPLGPIAGLNSTYDARWMGPWLGSEAGVIHEATRFFLDFAFHFADYSADADWNLRTDLAHPISFHHDATGYGIDLSAGVERRFGDNLSLAATFTYRKWKADNGIDTQFAANGATTMTKLNAVNWRSASWKVAATYLF